MPSWFKKVFKSAPLAQTAEMAEDSEAGPMFFDEDMEEDFPEPAPRRKVVHPPVIMANEEDKPGGDDIRIKARVESRGACVFMVNRPLFKGCSAWAPGPEQAGHAPLAQAIFAVDGVEAVLIHDMTVTVHRDPYQDESWDEMAKTIGGIIRAHLREGKPVVTEAFVESIPPEDDIRERLEAVLNQEINPGIAAHSGAIALDRVEGNTVYIEMMGGCQGCAASTMTLRQGVHALFREAVPELGAILDVTDHSAGVNPYYTSLPAGMG
jgi:Fe-S cluster biogenesis protein NfuA